MRRRWAYTLETHPEWHSMPVGMVRDDTDDLVCVVPYPEQPEHAANILRLLATNEGDYRALPLGPQEKESLLPCPFCGGTPSLIEWDGLYAVFCGSHAMMTATQRVHALSAWNYRRPIPAVEATAPIREQLQAATRSIELACRMLKAPTKETP